MKTKMLTSTQLAHRIGAVVLNQNIVFVCTALLNVVHSILVQVAAKSPVVAFNFVSKLRELCADVESKIPTTVSNQEIGVAEPAEVLADTALHQ